MPVLARVIGSIRGFRPRVMRCEYSHGRSMGSALAMTP